MAITYEQLREIDNTAAFDAWQESKPAASAELDGRTFTVQYRLVNRKCYDCLPTPTASYKIDGKRVARAVFYGNAI